MTQLPCEIIVKIQNILIENRELRAYYNLCKALQWDVDIKYFECEIRNNRYLECSVDDYDKKMIELWNRTGIDDGVPAEYLKKNLNKKTRIFKTMWALTMCSGVFFDIIKWYSHNEYVKNTYNIMQDTRTFSKYYKYKEKRWLPCAKCSKKFINELKKSNMNTATLEYKNLPVHKHNKIYLEYYKKKASLK